MKKKIYLVLGANSDIGTAYIKHLYSKKICDVIIAQYRKMNGTFSNLVEGCNDRMDVVQCDLSDTNEVKRLINYIKNKYDAPTHILSFASPPINSKRFKDIAISDLQYRFNVELYSAIHILSAFLPVMKKNKYGRVLVMLTAYTLGIPPKYLTEYVVSKYALLGLVKCLAVEFSGSDVTINALSPEMVNTKFLKNMDERQIEIIKNQLPMKRMVEVDEIVSAIDFIVADENKYMTGVNLNITGGSYI